ncbi:TetR/AcrR family transcriptional regulator [Streptomyces sp. NBC_00385]|uniref:TetR/AcrR family transcriptional regulator n=1 Tax=Streptomyces sp. NBC_00385 TaxID=2975733 RepID=UPI002DDBF0F4|nr:TetR/AcrR family transcriptional regulator [Streptomyces sp. NBC_00385]WRZ06447.1 TetR/AcrR family transcriptional regulator [Streptomyces sp. NBC_00385]
MAGQKKDSSEDGGGKGPDLSLWQRLEQPATAPRASLTLERIGTVAVEIADAEGFTAVTMRRLATELGVAPMAAYRHVSGKDDLWALMAERVTTEMRIPEEVTGWREVLRAFGVLTRDMMLRHPWVGQLPTHLFVLTPGRLAIAERQLAALDGLGLDEDAMMVAFRTVSAFAHGAAQSEVALKEWTESAGWSSGDETRLGLAPQMMYLMETGRYPTYQRYGRRATRKDDATWAFETGLDCVLDGIAARFGI